MPAAESAVEEVPDLPPVAPGSTRFLLGEGTRVYYRRERRQGGVGALAAWLTVGLALIVTSPAVWAQPSTPSQDAGQVEAAAADRAQLAPEDVSGRMTIREGVGATSAPVDEGIAGNEPPTSTLGCMRTTPTRV